MTLSDRALQRCFSFGTRVTKLLQRESRCTDDSFPSGTASRMEELNYHTRGKPRNDTRKIKRPDKPKPPGQLWADTRTETPSAFARTYIRAPSRIKSPVALSERFSRFAAPVAPFSCTASQPPPQVRSADLPRVVLSSAFLLGNGSNASGDFPRAMTAARTEETQQSKRIRPEENNHWRTRDGRTCRRQSGRLLSQLNCSTPDSASWLWHEALKSTCSAA